jgi:hypothetical protein
MYLSTFVYENVANWEILAEGYSYQKEDANIDTKDVILPGDS